MRTFVAMASGGLMGLLILKLLSVLLFPLLGFMAGLIGMAFKIMLWVLVAWVIYRLFKGKKEKAETVA